MRNTEHKSSWVAAGLLFALLWSSASTATKVGLQVAQPMVIAVSRFALAALIMLVYAHVIKRFRLPRGREWGQIAIYGTLNIAVYLGLYVVAMQEVTAGIGALAVAVNPVIMSVMAIVLLGKKLESKVVLALFICLAGVLCTAWPLLGKAEVTGKGLIVLLASMFSYSLAAIYFSAKKWDGLHLLTINGWQTLIGGLVLLPFLIFFYEPAGNQYTHTFWLAVSWLAVPVSIGAVQLWLWLTSRDTVKAGLWLFLCPLFGFVIAALLVGEPVSRFTIAGIALVLGGLFVSRQQSR
ncbi:EamA family transporter [Pedobacter yulinensis]|uniref:EamA family transporter n=1 Tax=Pedobacter yulinensis TaxID=2126353 RepID=A0A2T3HNK7_9SPHI|nr:EamA family transporter [Pedobacter yulinensis]PST83971.1 EamA family transporter [Pedobacter yulinensis]